VLALVNSKLNNMTKREKKWFWMMDYCKRKQIPPAQKWAWDEAEKKYNEEHN